MKKLMLACTAALFSLAAYAQENQQDTTRTETNQYRENRQQRTEQNMDTTSADDQNNQFRQDAEQLRNEGERELDTFEQDATQMRDTLVEQGNDAASELQNDARELRDSARQDAQQLGNEIEQGAERTQEDVENRVRTTRDDMTEDATRTGNEVKESAEQTGQSTQDSSSGEGSPAGSENENASSAANDEKVPAEVEVVEGKEGPNNEVVYKFNGEMWYVDRESKEMVKAEESKLRDSKHDIMVHEGNDTNTRGNKNNRKGKS